MALLETHDRLLSESSLRIRWSAYVADRLALRMDSFPL